ncbi:MAG: 3-methyl-2-oxobutanoate hydroxymethyltransferase [Acidimicrobiia bacterium]|nr:3-methyl-2-oxobutanoate hydroxymethyltransferase [Acidimicrobiia bacterium]MCY4433122.1 3-methyl-2-oxobutanoate hydroxymethyltransferase [bacterium]
MGTKLSAPAISRRKTSQGADPLVMLTAYDAPSARMADEAGADIILVGDSVAMVVLGHDDTMSVTVDEMAHHTAAVARTRPKAMVVADMPWMSYHVSVADTVINAAKLVRAGAQALKLEGGSERVPMIEAIVSAQVPVMGHLGLTPQSMLAQGGYRVQGKSSEAALGLVADAKALAHAGCFAIVLEGMPAAVGQMITDAVDVSTIGIGAGGHCDGQVLVFHDVLGLETRMLPRFVRRYATLHDDGVDALGRFAADVRSGAFPDLAECYEMNPDEEMALGLYGHTG